MSRATDPLCAIEQQGDDVVATYSGSWDTFTRFISTSSTSNYVSGNGNFQALQGLGEKDYMSTTPMPGRLRHTG